mmetsp:Transcript_28205/g.38815  ORF Transcript_28205/g.38815 Transcript_28205/m.38815 type:complete len:250 (+) Transcript_28205:11-760(+)
MMMMMSSICLLLLCTCTSFRTFKIVSVVNSKFSLFQSTNVEDVILERAPYDEIIPFLSEHIQLSDQILFLGSGSDMPLRLVQDGYGTKKTGFVTIVDSSVSSAKKIMNSADSDPSLEPFVKSGKLKVVSADFANMPQICKQSHYDAIVDYLGLDSLLSGPSASIPNALKCIDHLQNAVRLGNILVCISKLDPTTFCAPFEQRFGWVQELDGEPGEISAWYRGKSNILATSSRFKQLGLYMYVYTNTDNC